MDHYPEVNISERECSSGRNSTASSITNSHKSSLDHPSRHSSHLAPPQYTSFPPPSDASEQQRTRNDSVHSNRSNHDSKSHEQSPATVLEKELARFTEAPPPYSPKAYEGKSEDEKTRMKMVDYARGISRMMGRQLVRGLKSKESGGK